VELAAGRERGLFFDAADDRVDMNALVGEVPGGGQTGGALVASPAEDDHPLAAATPAKHGKREQCGYTAAILGDLEDIEAELFLRDALDVPHLGCGDGANLADLALWIPARVRFHGHRS